jgi:hypothetical protein
VFLLKLLAFSVAGEALRASQAGDLRRCSSWQGRTHRLAQAASEVVVGCLMAQTNLLARSHQCRHPRTPHNSRTPHAGAAAIKYGSLLMALPFEPSPAVALAVVLGTPIGFSLFLLAKGGKA